MSPAKRNKTDVLRAKRRRGREGSQRRIAGKDCREGLQEEMHRRMVRPDCKGGNMGGNAGELKVFGQNYLIFTMK